jgi:Tol biopolymer transport system component
VWRVGADGSNPTQLTTVAGEYLNPVWSPDGGTVVFVAGSGASARGQMLAENPFYELRAVPASGGPSRLISVVNPPSGRLSHRRHIVQPSFGPGGRVVYPEMIQVNGEWRTEVRSIAIDGTDRRTHATIPAADEAALSPDGRWLAFEEGDNVFLIEMPAHGIGGRPRAREGEGGTRGGGGGRSTHRAW